MNKRGRRDVNHFTMDHNGSPYDYNFARGDRRRR